MVTPTTSTATRERSRLTQAIVAAHPLLRPDLVARGRPPARRGCADAAMHPRARTLPRTTSRSTRKRTVSSSPATCCSSARSEAHRQTRTRASSGKASQRLVAEVPDDATVWPGHDYGARPSSTMALEKSTNPFLLCRTVNEFLQLEGDWPSFKKEHGLR